MKKDWRHAVTEICRVQLAEQAIQELNGLRQLVQQLQAMYPRLPDNHQQVVWDSDLDRLNNPEDVLRLKVLVVGDNPGDLEAINGVFFHNEGQAGFHTRDLLEMHRVEPIERLFLEKSLIFTPETADLKKLTNDLAQVSRQLEEQLARLVALLQLASSCLLWIQGTGGCWQDNQWGLVHRNTRVPLSNRLFYTFFSTLRSIYNNSNPADWEDKIYITPHTSKGAIFRGFKKNDFRAQGLIAGLNAQRRPGLLQPSPSSILRPQLCPLNIQHVVLTCLTSRLR